jgi:multidrug efflux system membrane fusion protein
VKKHAFPVLLAIVAALVVGAACRKGDGAAGGGRSRQAVAFPVEVAPVEIRSLVYAVNAVGSVEAFEKVQVTARVAGVVDRVLFSEGSPARVGQVLAEIEPERYRLAVEAAQAAFEKAEAAKADAEAGLKRRETVINQTPGLIPGEELETWRTKVRLAASDVAQTKAALNQANLNLHDAFVRAPVAGILQTRTVQTGQYIQVGMVLATLVQRDPLLLRFKAPERDAARLRVGQEAGFRVRDINREFHAKIVHVAASADSGTRMVELAAEIKESGDEALRPGTFAEIVIPVESSRPAPVIPQTAIRPSERGFLAFVVENDKAVERVLGLGLRTAEGQVEVLTGLKEGEALVIRGSEALRNGVAVRISAAAAPPGAARPATEGKATPPAKRP